MNKKSGLNLVVICLVVVLASCSAPEEKRIKFFEKGQALYEKGDYVKARLEFKNVLQIDPEFAEGYHMLGMAELETGNFQEAFLAFQKAVSLDSSRLDSQLEMGKLLLLSGSPEEALEKAELILIDDPRHREAIILKGSVYVEKMKTDAAIEFLGEQVRNYGDTAELYALLASAHVMKEDFSRAEEVLKDGISKNPDSVPLLLDLAMVYGATSKMKQAEDLIKAVTRLAPDQPDHKFSLASLQWSQGRETDAIGLVQDLVNRDPNRSSLVAAAALFYMDRSEFAKAEKVLQEGIRSVPEDIQLRLQLGELYVEMGHEKLACETLEKALHLKDDPKNQEVIQIKTILAGLHLSMNDLENARTYVEDILKHSPNNLEGLLAKGNILLQRGENEKAVSQFRMVVNDNPDYVHGYLALARAHLANSDLLLARDTVKEALKVDPMSRGALRAMAGLHMQSRNYEAAEEKLRKLIEIDPYDLQSKAELGDLMLARRQYREAEKIYREIRQMEPGDDTVCVRLARLYAVQGRPDRATEELEACVKTGSISNDLLAALVQRYMEGNHYDAAMALCEKRITEDQDDPFALDLLGTVYMAQGRHEMAEKAFLQATQINPNFGPAFKNLAVLRKMQGNVEESIQYLDRLIQASPRDVSAYVSLAMLFDETGDVAGAIQTYEMGIDINPGSWVLKNNLAFMISQKSDTKEQLERALALAKEANKAQSDNPIVLDTLGWANYRLGNHDKAYQCLSTALRLDPENRSANYHMAVVRKAMGKKDEAQERFTKFSDG